MSSRRRFHIAFPVHDLEIAREFYVNSLLCKTGRESEKWIDFNLFGHQIVAHLSPQECDHSHLNKVDNDDIPTRHFGVILEWGEWEDLCKRLKKLKVKLLIEPKIRFKNKNGEQGTLFLKDPSGNVIEFKTFKNDSNVFKK
tara:strand:+ start:1816 stop:2238 length:423 start_codon:yes stop_codon:yes gene_type:complete